MCKLIEMASTSHRTTSSHAERAEHAVHERAALPSSMGRRAVMLDAAVHRSAKAFAASEGLTLTAWATAAIRAALPTDARKASGREVT